jgi:DinB family protein
MNAASKEIIWQQFGAAIDMLDNAMRECPDGLWSDRSQRPEYWYLVYHTLFWLDLYLSGGVEGFTPPAPFTLEELDPAGIIPERPYSKAELRGYLEQCRRKCRKAIDTLTEEQDRQRYRFGWGEASYSEMLLYNMRHVQHHAAQLNLILRQQTDSAPRWVARAK